MVRRCGGRESSRASAACGGTTTVIPFAAQHRGQSMMDVVADYRERAKKAVVDHAFHMIISDPTEAVLADDLPALIRDGYSSLKLFMTYPLLRLDDGQMLELLALARREGAMVSVHAENDAMLAWTARRGLFIEPTSAAAVAGYRKALASRVVAPDETVVVVLTGHGLKAAETVVRLLAATPVTREA